MLIALGGLPATGKTTIARALAAETGAVHLRIDTIEQAIVRSGLASHPIGAAGYAVGYALAEDLLRQGHAVVADCVNPLAVTRRAWVGAARRAGARWLEVEVVCGDRAEHERRSTVQRSDIEGLADPSWDAIEARDYEPWAVDLVVDTAVEPLARAVERIRSAAGI